MKTIAKLTIFLFFIGSISFIVIPKYDMLTISDTKTGKILHHIKLENQDEFVLSFTHSINKRPVYEYIKTHDGQMTVYKAIYDAFGAGMPETSTNGSSLKMKENGVIELTNINRQMDEFAVFVGTIANHKISIHNQDIPLNTIGNPGQSLTFKIIHSSYFDLWKNML